MAKPHLFVKKKHAWKLWRKNTIIDNRSHSRSIGIITSHLGLIYLDLWWSLDKPWGRLRRPWNFLPSYKQPPNLSSEWSFGQGCQGKSIMSHELNHSHGKVDPMRFKIQINPKYLTLSMSKLLLYVGSWLFWSSLCCLQMRPVVQTKHFVVVEHCINWDSKQWCVSQRYPKGKTPSRLEKKVHGSTKNHWAFQVSIKNLQEQYVFRSTTKQNTLLAHIFTPVG